MTWIILLYFGGLALILSEFFVPGMVCGILGGSMILASGVMGIMRAPEYTVFIVLGELTGVMLGTILGMYLLGRTRAANKLVLATNQNSDEGWVAADSDMSILHAEGEVLTQLRPAGIVVVNGKRVDAVSDGSFIDKGARVRVIEVQGARVVVELAN